MNDRRAYTAIAWLLMPGASLVAGRLRRLTEVIDQVVSGQLWIQICEHDPADDTYVAATILRAVERESLAEPGLGELAKRRDPTWASAVLIERYDETIPAEEPDAEEAPVQLIEFLRRALDSGALSDQDRDLLLDLALAAESRGCPAAARSGGADDAVGCPAGEPGSRARGADDPSPRCQCARQAGGAGSPEWAGDLTLPRGCFARPELRCRPLEVAAASACARQPRRGAAGPGRSPLGQSRGWLQSSGGPGSPACQRSRAT